MSGTSGMSGVSGVSDVSNIFFRTKSSEQYLLEQFFSNSASETILLLLQNWDVRGVRGVREVRDVWGVRVVSNFFFRTKSSEQYLLEQFLSNSASETILLNISSSASVVYAFRPAARNRLNSSRFVLRYLYS